MLARLKSSVNNVREFIPMMGGEWYTVEPITTSDMYKQVKVTKLGIVVDTRFLVFKQED